MKKINFYIVMAYLMLIPGYLFAGWNTPDKGYFKTQKDIENEVSDYSQSQATISFGGKLFNFIYYNDGSAEIIVRKLTNNASSGIKWSDTKQDNIPNLSDLWPWDYWQPAPVIFNNVLYLFVFDFANNNSNASAATPYYSEYNAGEDSWGPLQLVFAQEKNASRYMAAVVVDDKLCLIIQGTNGNASIFWTTDLITWVECPTDLQPNCEISAITKTYMGAKPDGTKKVEFNILLGYIDSAKF